MLSFVLKAPSAILCALISFVLTISNKVKCPALDFFSSALLGKRDGLSKVIVTSLICLFAAIPSTPAHAQNTDPDGFFGMPYFPFPSPGGNDPIYAGPFTVTSNVSRVTEDGGVAIVLTFKVPNGNIPRTVLPLRCSGTVRENDFTFFPCNGAVVQFGNGKDTETLTFNVRPDRLVEPDEIFRVVADRNRPSDPFATVIIENDDFATVPSVTLSSGFREINENDGVGATYRINVATPSPTPLAVKVNTSPFLSEAPNGRAVSGVDYVALPSSIIVPAGASFVDFQVRPINNSRANVDKSLVIELSDDPSYDKSRSNGFILKILNDDFPKANISVAPASVTEGGPDNLVFTISLDQPAEFLVQPNIIFAGQATNGPDYSITSPEGRVDFFAPGQTSKRLIVRPKSDAIDELDETVVLQLAPDPVRQFKYDLGASPSATGIIKNNNAPIGEIPVATVSVSPATVLENSGTGLVFTVTLSRAVPRETAVFIDPQFDFGDTRFRVSESLVLPPVFGAPGFILIPANERSATVTITPVDNNAINRDLDVGLTIFGNWPNPAYVPGAASSATGTIVDDERVNTGPPPTATLTVSPERITEGTNGKLVYTVNFSSPTTQTVFLTWDVSTTTNPGEIDPIPQPVQVPPNTSSVVIAQIGTVNDTEVEPNETVTVTLKAGVGYVLGTQISAIGTIVDDDVVTVVPSASIILLNTPATVPEKLGILRYRIELSAPVPTPTTVKLNYSGTAVSGVDYRASPTEIVIPINTRSVEFTIDTFDNNVIAADKTIEVGIPNGPGYTVSAASNTQATILNDDVPFASISVTPPSAKEDSGQLFTFTVRLSEPSPLGPTRVLLSALSGGFYATPRTDYNGFPEELLFPQNTTELTFNVRAVVDTVKEADEQIGIAIQAEPAGNRATYKPISSNPAFAIIQNDDFLPPTITNVTPLVGSAGLNSPVPNIVIDGTDFDAPNPSVSIGNVPAASFAINSPGRIFATPRPLTAADLNQDGVALRKVTVQNAAGVVISTQEVALDGAGPVAAAFPVAISVPTDVGKPTAIVTYANPSWTDYSNFEVLPTVGLPSGSAFPLGVSTVTFSSVDIYNNKSTTVLTITVQDKEAPVFAGVPANITVNTDTDRASAIVTWVVPTAKDNAGSASLTQTAGPTPGSAFPIGVTTVTYRSVDAAGNASLVSFTVTVLDKQPPVIAGLPTDIIADTDAGKATATVRWVEPTATDNSGTATITRTTGLASGSAFPIGVTTVTYVATDPSGNQTTRSFTVTVRDREVPVISGMPANISVNTDAGLATATVTWTLPTATDNVPGVVLRQTEGPARGGAFPVGVSRVTYVATDVAGNTASASFTVTVADKEPPAIVGLSANLSFDIDYPNTTRVVTWAEPTVRDNVPGATITQTAGPKSGSALPIGTTTMTYEAKDVAGNIARASFTVTLRAIPPGSITFILESQDGGSFSVSGSEAALNASMTAGPGRSSMSPILIRPGSYPISFAVPEGAGIVEASCTAGGSALNIASKTGTIVLVSGQAVTCTIKTLASQRVATETVATLFEARQALILANQPSTDRRINRLVGQGAAGGGSVNLGGLQFANKSPFNVSIDRDGRASFTYSSMRARQLSDLASASDPTGGDVDATRLPGSKRTGLDFWAEGTLAKFEIGYGDGNFAILHLGADYLASKNLLVGATAQLDWIDFDTTGDATTKGKGFMVGPYITARLSENLFFDARVTAGTASNDISPYGTYVDSVDSNRTLTSAALIGSFQRGKMTVRPEARLNWFIEESDAYKDSLGVMVPSVRASTGTLDLGPEFRWSLGAKELGDVEVSVGLAGIWAFDQTLKSDANIALDRVMLPDFRARMKSGALLTLENGVVFNADVFMDGIGGGDYRSWGGSLGVRFGF
jgi:hypothetical protein